MDQDNDQCSDNERLRAKVRVTISYGGRFLRNPDHELCYMGGDTKILVLDRDMKFLDIVASVNSLCNLNTPYELRYRLRGEGDLETLITVANDEDVENMMDEYDSKQARMRLFVLEPAAQCVQVQRSDSLNPDYLFGFDKEYDPNASPNNFVIPEFPDKRDFGYQENHKEKGAPRTQHKTQCLQRIETLMSEYLSGFEKEYDPNANPEKLEVPELPEKRDSELSQENKKEEQVESQKEENEKVKQVDKKKQVAAEESQGITPCNNTRNNSTERVVTTNNDFSVVNIYVNIFKFT